MRAAVIVYAGIIAGLAFFPFPLPPWDPDLAIVQPWILPIPLQTITLAIQRGWPSPEMTYLIGNVVAFAPIGVLLALLRPGAHSWRRALATGLGVSLVIESVQIGLSIVIGFPYRQFDVDDLLLNTLGAALGYGFARLTRSTTSA